MFIICAFHPNGMSYALEHQEEWKIGYGLGNAVQIEPYDARDNKHDTRTSERKYLEVSYSRYVTVKTPAGVKKEYMTYRDLSLKAGINDVYLGWNYSDDDNELLIFRSNPYLGIEYSFINIEIGDMVSYLSATYNYGLLNNSQIPDKRSSVKDYLQNISGYYSSLIFAFDLEYKLSDSFSLNTRLEDGATIYEYSSSKDLLSGSGYSLAGNGGNTAMNVVELKALYGFKYYFNKDAYLRVLSNLQSGSLIWLSLAYEY